MSSSDKWNWELAFFDDSWKTTAKVCAFIFCIATKQWLVSESQVGVCPGEYT